MPKAKKERKPRIAKTKVIIQPDELDQQFVDLLKLRLPPPQVMLDVSRAYYGIQKLRIATGNTVLAHKKRLLLGEIVAAAGEVDPGEIYTILGAYPDEIHNLTPKSEPSETLVRLLVEADNLRLKRKHISETIEHFGDVVSGFVGDRFLGGDRQYAALYSRSVNAGLAGLEERLYQYMCTWANRLPLYRDWLKDVPGIGPTLTCALVAELSQCRSMDSTKFGGVLHFAGLAPKDGKAMKPVKGEKLSWNRWLKTTLFKCVGQFLQVGVEKSSYAALYYQYREDYDNRLVEGGEKWAKNDLHAHLAACRKVECVFLNHIWTVWRTLEGKPIRRPWYQVHLRGHDTWFPPPAFDHNRIVWIEEVSRAA